MQMHENSITEQEALYELPEGWKWCRLGDVCETSKEKSEIFSQETKYVGLEHIDSNGKINGYGSAIEIKSLKNVFHKNQILYGKLRPYLNKHDIADFDGVCSTDILVFNAKKDCSNKYINYFFNLPYFIDFVVSNSKGINLPRVSETIVLDIPFPLPPTLAEQQRIVNRIETMFAKLDEAKEKAQNVVDSFEHRKATILHKAFTGKLTANWRKENGVSDESWEEKRLEELSDKIGDGLHGTPIFDNEGKYAFVNGNNFFVDHIEIKTGTKFVGEAEYKKHFIQLSDNTVFVSINGTLGKTAFYNNEEIILGKSACFINVIPSILDKHFLRWLFESKYFIDYANEKATGSTIKNLGLKAMRNLKIKLPSLPEQQEIVRILDTVLEKESRAKDAAQTVLNQIALLKKSILARAFRGDV